MKNYEGMEATYSPEDNKLRLYSLTRLDKELYNKVREIGFRYAPKQELFVAPKWTPERRDLLIELCGDIQDEQTSVEERAEQRAERFEGYQTNRKQDAENAYQDCKNLIDGIPFGQPILVGHHSERRARRQADKIERAMDKAVTMWDRSDYWESRARGVLSHASYKEDTGLRLRRIKKIEANRRRQQKYIDQAKKTLDLWNNPEKELTLKRSLAIANYNHYGLWSKIDKGDLTPEEAREKGVSQLNRSIAFNTDWVNHNTFRINYENSILDSQGYIKPEKVKKTLPPIINISEGFIGITKEEWKAVGKDYKGTKKVAATEILGAYRYRHAMHIKGQDAWSLCPIYIKDQKEVSIPILKKEVA